MFAHLTIATRDVRRTSEFFQRTLGWQPIHMPSNVNLEADWLQMAQGQQLHILRVADFSVSPFEREFGRHFAIFLARAEFPALKQRLVEHGAELIPPIRETPFERFFFRDPNGYMFEVIDGDGYVLE
jgi:catechol 2,3-dioxygenase-like lactoylglutathione lyase family enzyme